jgi:DNA helicase-2/ATP-dependent DNA helicase PcrA
VALDLSGLNPQQREAVKTTEGPVLVLAGAGSGKTRVITVRIAYLLSKGVSPERILAVSFTNKAAGEMRERVEGLVGKAARDVSMSTFHAFGMRFLRDEHAHLDLGRRFVILDEDDQRNIVRDGLRQLNFDPDRYKPPVIHARISEAKNALKAPNPRSGHAFDAVASHVFPLYQRRLRALNAVDFDDLIGLPVQLLEKDPEIRGRWANRFRYVMVDEYQDTNGAQLRLIRALAGVHGNLCVVGDDDQSIYAWRGAVAGNILRFGEQFPGARTIMLTQNYRSTNNILRCANAVIASNDERLEKELWSENGDGEAVRYHLAETGDDEADFIASDMIRRRGISRARWEQFGLLYRTNAQSQFLQHALRSHSIPYRVIGGQEFYDRTEVKDVLAYLRAIADEYDEVALRRIINVPVRGVGDTSVERIGAYAKAEGIPFSAAVTHAADGRVSDIPRRARAGLEGLVALLKVFRERFAGRPNGDVCRDLILTVRFADEIVRTTKDVRKRRIKLENVEEIASAVAAYAMRRPEASLSDYLATCILDRRPEDKAEDAGNHVTLMTLHGSKGLEFDYVWLAGVEEGFLPSQRVLDGEGDVSEERRLTYVGITRARRVLTLSGARSRLSFGNIKRRKPSRFLDDIPPDLLDRGRGGPKLSPEDQQAAGEAFFASMLADLTDE